SSISTISVSEYSPERSKSMVAAEPGQAARVDHGHVAASYEKPAFTVRSAHLFFARGITSCHAR
ncbi:MAG: hypothetical protein ABTR27_16875, partial [Candidatus Competibacter phosphatis]